MNDGDVRVALQAFFDDLLGPLGIGEEEELRLLHRGVDPIGIQPIGLTEEECRVLDRAVVAEHTGDPVVHLRTLRVDLESAAVLEERIHGLAGLDVLLGALHVRGELLFVRRTSA